MKESNLVFDGLSSEKVLKLAEREFGGDIVFATSMSVEDQVLLDMIVRLGLDVDIFTLDTGRLFNETYDLISQTESRYGVKIEVYSPDRVELERMVNKDGINLFYNGVEERRMCCRVRKLNPLKRALSGYSVWVCGLRREQSVTREDVKSFEWDEMNGMYKLNPLTDWSESDV